MALQEVLKKLRKQKGLSQLEAAHQIGISNTALSNYETGYRQPDLALLVHIAAFYEVSVDALLGLSQASEFVDLWQLSHNAVFVYKGTSYIMTEHQRNEFRRVLQEFFEHDRML